MVTETEGFRPPTQKIVLRTKYYVLNKYNEVLCESTAKEISFEWSHH